MLCEGFLAADQLHTRSRGSPTPRRIAKRSKTGFGLGADCLAVELTSNDSNDGYLLQHFLPRGMPVLGVEPTANVAFR